jgi:small subunit ribosomal protein S20
LEDPLANHKSAIKRARQSLKRRAVNTKTLTEIRTLEKKVVKFITAKDKAGADAALVTFMSRVSKAAQKGRMHVSTASRKIARISKRVNAVK